ncbi:MAG: tRNA-dihydrouridine synthase family protein [Phycisphaerales bacterium]|nr:tRNA-dihydrouridine synthase family protein [Phycisphaerales bacterium]
MISKPLQLNAPQGTVRLESNLLLAPIAGWCELAWRITCRELGGVGLACTDLLSPKGLLLSSDTTRDLAQTNDLDKPIGMQLYGSDPEILAEGAAWCAAHGATVVDINMGCPVDKVTKKNGGSMLMCDLDNTFAIFERVRAAMPGHVPLTAKMRLGWDEQAKNAGIASRLSLGLVERGAAMITVHGRTTEQKFKGSCDLQGIKRVVDDVHERFPDVPVIGNGDIKHETDVIRMLHNTGCAGVMIGRGSFSNPWLFRYAWALQQRVIEQGIDPGDEHAVASVDLSDIRPSEHEKLDMLRDFFDRMITYRDEHHARHVFRQKANLLGKPINGGHCRPLKNALREAKTAQDVYDAIEGWRARHESGGLNPDHPGPLDKQPLRCSRAAAVPGLGH